MYFIILFLLSFFTAVAGIAPPGLINMSAVKISSKEGNRSALWFVFGAVLVICLQVILALFFARALDKRPDLIQLLREIGFVIFSFLTIYFLFVAKKPQKKKSNIKKYSKSSRFFQGILVSALNMFPLPYYVIVTIGLSAYKLFVFDGLSSVVFVSGVVLGSVVVFYGYIYFFDKIKSKTDFIIKNINTIIGCVTGLVAVLTLINIVAYYF